MSTSYALICPQREWHQGMFPQLQAHTYRENEEHKLGSSTIFHSSALKISELTKYAPCRHKNKPLHKILQALLFTKY